MVESIALGGVTGELRALTGDDGPELQSLLERCGDYSLTNFGVPTGDADAQSSFLSGLEHVPPERKHLMGLDFEGQLVAAADFLSGHPEPDSGSLGMLVVDPRYRDLGIGTAILREVAGWMYSAGLVRLRVDCHVAENVHAARLLQRLGFREQSRQQVAVAAGQTRTRVFWIAGLPLPDPDPDPGPLPGPGRR